jgi:hypothetical protein
MVPEMNLPARGGLGRPRFDDCSRTRGKIAQRRVSTNVDRKLLALGSYTALATIHWRGSYANGLAKRVASLQILQSLHQIASWIIGRQASTFNSNEAGLTNCAARGVSRFA